MRLTDKYRPQTFEEVIGQAHLVPALIALVRQDEGTPLFLGGPFGTGKTSLARICAKAMNCHALTASGSPCLQCEPCLDFDDPSNRAFFYLEMNAGKHGDKEAAAYINELARYQPPINVARRVIFIDEAHLLTRPAQDALLGVFEQPGGPAFILATTENISGALASRCHHGMTRLATTAEAIAYGRRICVDHNVAYEPDALDLVAAATGGHLRDLAMYIDQFAARGGLRVADVAPTLNLDWANFALCTLRSLARGDARAVQVIQRNWTASPETKARALRDALVHIAHVTHTPLAQRPDASAAFLLAERALIDEVAQALANCPGAAGVPPLAYLLAQADRWSSVAPRLRDNGDLDLELTRQAHAITPSDASLAPIPITPLDQGPTIRRRASAPRRDRAQRDIDARRPVYLTKAQARGEYRAATMLLQEYGVHFNVRLIVRWADYGILDWASACKELSALTHELGLRVRDWVGDARWKLHYLAQHEAAADGCTTWLLCHLPTPHLVRAREWIAQALPLTNGRLFNSIGDDIWRAGTVSGRELLTHWSVVRELWRALDPNLTQHDGLLKRPLKEVLGVPPQGPRAAGVLPDELRRFTTSQTLSGGAWAAAQSARFGFLSAFDAQEWRLIAKGWEAEEYAHRRAEAWRRAEEIARIHAQFPPGLDAQTDLTREQKLRRFEERLPHDPLARPRQSRPW